MREEKDKEDDVKMDKIVKEAEKKSKEAVDKSDKKEEAVAK